MPDAFPLSPPASERHLISLLQRRAAVAPRATLVTHGAHRQTAEDLLSEGETFARALAAAGLQRGDRVAMQCGNRREFLEVLVGCALAGVVLVPINTASRGTQLAYYLRNSGAKAFITEPLQFSHLASVCLVDDTVIKGLQAIWSLDPIDGDAGLQGIADLADAPREDGFEPTGPDATSAAIVMYTSGTSGPSKGVISSHAQLYWWGAHARKNLGIGRSDVLYTCLPMFHINALNTFYQALLSGGSMVVGLKFSVSQFYNELGRTEATVTYLLGAMIPMLLSRHPDESESKHRVRVALAPAASQHHYEAFERRTGIRIIDGYGSTETNFVICTSLEDRRPGWMGTLVEGYQARVVDEHDNEVAPGTPGELILRHDEPFAFSSGYFEMPEKTVEAWRNLWFHTGDRVLRDQQGYFRFVDRIKDSIRRRGENISSYEVEQVITSHADVEVSAVYAVPSDLGEDDVMCAVVLREGSALDPLDLIKWCEPRLPYFSIPRYVRFVREVPKTESGKIEKYKLRAEGLTPDTWDLAASGYTIKR